ncbi:methanogenesis marker 5 protein [Methanosalsum natronophilum]|uniref:Methanogenesis marker 5 protein n=1 Tax=Methanosalsum natronophilum TaxID=768733 RepID=A0A424YV70_9EURY|nr:methanogenesis marker 5 protein [Methanosalsum natronophilum]MCS3924018.1 putative methanogenesis marker protein 5 [Methanosalsum natronophilum]RQD83082.1 MAG: methanogenesis marker 5 protein [Methanosalsum natronophilum]
MAQIIIYPTTSLILSDLVRRFGHEPLVMMEQIREKINTVGIDSPPLNITGQEPKKGLKYAAVEVPAGVRGRMALVGPLIDSAEAGIIVDEPDIAFGCMGCARTNELTKYLIRQRDIPLLEIYYPRTEDEGKEFVKQIATFLKELNNNSKNSESEEEAN